MADGAVKQGQGLGGVGGMVGVRGARRTGEATGDALDEGVIAATAVVGFGKGVAAK